MIDPEDEDGALGSEDVALDRWRLGKAIAHIADKKRQSRPIEVPQGTAFANRLNAGLESLHADYLARLGVFVSDFVEKIEDDLTVRAAVTSYRPAPSSQVDAHEPGAIVDEQLVVRLASVLSARDRFLIVARWQRKPSVSFHRLAAAFDTSEEHVVEMLGHLRGRFRAATDVLRPSLRPRFLEMAFRDLPELTIAWPVLIGSRKRGRVNMRTARDCTEACKALIYLDGAPSLDDPAPPLAEAMEPETVELETATCPSVLTPAPIRPPRLPIEATVVVTRKTPAVDLTKLAELITSLGPLERVALRARYQGPNAIYAEIRTAIDVSFDVLFRAHRNGLRHLGLAAPHPKAKMREKAIVDALRLVPPIELSGSYADSIRLKQLLGLEPPEPSCSASLGMTRGVPPTTSVTLSAHAPAAGVDRAALALLIETLEPLERVVLRARWQAKGSLYGEIREATSLSYDEVLRAQRDAERRLAPALHFPTAVKRAQALAETLRTMPAIEMAPPYADSPAIDRLLGLRTSADTEDVAGPLSPDGWGKRAPLPPPALPPAPPAPLPPAPMDPPHVPPPAEAQGPVDIAAMESLTKSLTPIQRFVLRALCQRTPPATYPQMCEALDATFDRVCSAITTGTNYLAQAMRAKVPIAARTRHVHAALGRIAPLVMIAPISENESACRLLGLPFVYGPSEHAVAALVRQQSTPSLTPRHPAPPIGEQLDRALVDHADERDAPARRGPQLPPAPKPQRATRPSKRRALSDDQEARALAYAATREREQAAAIAAGVEAAAEQTIEADVLRAAWRKTKQRFAEDLALLEPCAAPSAADVAAWGEMADGLGLVPMREGPGFTEDDVMRARDAAAKAKQVAGKGARQLRREREDAEAIAAGEKPRKGSYTW